MLEITCKYGKIIKRGFMSLIIKKNGKLIKTKWNEKTQKNIDKDVSKYSMRYLFDECSLDSDVTLKDVLKLINKNLDIYDLIIGNWCKDLVTEGLKGKIKNKDLDIDKLELYWRISKDKDIDTKQDLFAGYLFPSFHGKGIATSEKDGHKKGEEVNWSLSFLSVADIRDIPLVLEENTFIYNEDNWNEKPIAVGKPVFSLGHIIHGIIWELSFYGNPKTRDQKSAEMLKITENIKSGKSKTVPFKDVLKDLLYNENKESSKLKKK